MSDWYKINRHQVGLDSDHLGSYIKDALPNLLVGDYVGAVKNIDAGRENRKVADEIEQQKLKTIEDKNFRKRVRLARLGARGVGDSSLADVSDRQLEEAYESTLSEYDKHIKGLRDAYKSNYTELGAELLFNSEVYDKPGEFRNLGGMKRDAEAFNLGGQLKKLGGNITGPINEFTKNPFKGIRRFFNNDKPKKESTEKF